MLNLSDIKAGKNIVLEKTPYAVLYHEQSKTGRAGSVLRTRIKNLITGAVLEKTFQGADQVEEADVARLDGGSGGRQRPGFSHSSGRR